MKLVIFDFQFGLVLGNFKKKKSRHARRKIGIEITFTCSANVRHVLLGLGEAKALDHEIQLVSVLLVEFPLISELHFRVNLFVHARFDAPPNGIT